MKENSAFAIFRDLKNLIKECRTSLEEACCMNPLESISFSLDSETVKDIQKYSIRIDRYVTGAPESHYAMEDKITVSILPDRELQVRFYPEMTENEPCLIEGYSSEEWTRTLKSIREFCLDSIL